MRLLVLSSDFCACMQAIEEWQQPLLKIFIDQVLVIGSHCMLWNILHSCVYGSCLCRASQLRSFSCSDRWQRGLELPLLRPAGSSSAGLATFNLRGWHSKHNELCSVYMSNVALRMQRIVVAST